MAEVIDKGRLWLFDNTYKQTDRHPVFTGNGEISSDVLRKLVNNLKNEKPADAIVKLQCAAWNKVSQAGKKYLFVTIDLAEEKKPNEAPSNDGKPDNGNQGQEAEEDIPW